MWLIRNLAWLAIMIVVIGFSILNVNERVTAIRLPGLVYEQISLNVVLFIAFVAGMLVAFVLTLVQQLKGRAALNRMSRENQNLKEELRALRNLPLEDLKLGGRSGEGS
jgi:uncharacterized integral membrane protein